MVVSLSVVVSTTTSCSRLECQNTLHLPTSPGCRTSVLSTSMMYYWDTDRWMVRTSSQPTRRLRVLVTPIPYIMQGVHLVKRSHPIRWSCVDTFSIHDMVGECYGTLHKEHVYYVFRSTSYLKTWYTNTIHSHEGVYDGGVEMYRYHVTCTWTLIGMKGIDENTCTWVWSVDRTTDTRNNTSPL